MSKIGIADKETLDKVARAVGVKGDNKIYGLKIDKNNPDPRARCEYLGDAVGMSRASCTSDEYFLGTVIHLGDWADAWFVKDPYMLNFMKNNMKLNTFLYNEVTDIHLSPKPNEAKHITEERIDVDVMTYGTLYPYRNRILKHLLDSGIKISLYGTKPHRFIDEDIRKIYTGEFILGERRAEVIYGSKIALNTLHFAEIDGVNARFFQINGCGGFQLCDYRPILKELLPVDPELVSYRNTDECIEKVQYYLNHPQERYDIADKIYRHSIKHFTFDNLVSYILSVVETL